MGLRYVTRSIVGLDYGLLLCYVVAQQESA